jgi:hypothetical protein
MLIFVYPLFLLGTCTPSLVKYAVGSLDDSGKTVGLLNASNTIGSIIGTFVPTFLSIPAFGTAVTFLIFSGILLLLAAVYFVSCKRKIVRVCVCTVLFVLCCVFGTRAGFAFWEKGLTYVSEGTITSDEYMQKLRTFVTRRTDQVKAGGGNYALKEAFERVRGFYREPVPSAGRSRRKRTAPSSRAKA